jgi:hypothetical protein
VGGISFAMEEVAAQLVLELLDGAGHRRLGDGCTSPTRG